MNTEIVVNLWAVVDGSTGFIRELAGKAYSISGTYQQKVDLLKALSATDHVTAERFRVSDRFSVNFEDGSEEFGVARLSWIHFPGAPLFEEVFQEIERELPPIFDPSIDEFEVTDQRIPQSPICVITVLYEDKDGSIRPIITDEDSEWFRAQEKLAHRFDNACGEDF